MASKTAESHSIVWGSCAVLHSQFFKKIEEQRLKRISFTNFLFNLKVYQWVFANLLFSSISRVGNTFFEGLHR